MKGDIPDHEKGTAFQRMANIITLNPNGIRDAIIDFINAVTHWEGAPSNLKKAFKQVSLIRLVKTILYDLLFFRIDIIEVRNSYFFYFTYSDPSKHRGQLWRRKLKPILSQYRT